LNPKISLEISAAAANRQAAPGSFATARAVSVGQTGADGARSNASDLPKKIDD
jgi:hypothetical protein